MSDQITNFGTTSMNQIDTSPSVILEHQIRNTSGRVQTADDIKAEFDHYLAKQTYSEILKDPTLDEFYNRYLIYSEQSKFFNENIKTSMAISLNKTIADSVIDSNVYFQNADGEELTELQYKGMSIQLDNYMLEDIIKYGNLYGKILLLPHVTNKNEITFDVVHPWQYRITNNKLEMVFYKRQYIKDTDSWSDIPILFTRTYTTIGDQYLIKDRYKNTITNRNIKTIDFMLPFIPFKEVRTERIFTDGFLELSLVYSATWTSLYKDIKTGAANLFVDARYTDDDYGNVALNQMNYVPLNGSATQGLSDQIPKPLFEHVSPNLRSSEHETILNKIESRLSNLANIPVELLSSSMNKASATGSLNLESKLAKRFNKTKKMITQDLNELFAPIGITIIVESYKTETKESILKAGVLLKANGVGTQLPMLRDFYSDKPDDWIMTEYLKTEIKNQSYLTDDEITLAKSFGLISSDYTNNASDTKTSTSSITGDNQMDNSDKVNFQGVDATDQT